MNIQIKTKDGEKISLMINPTDLIRDLKIKIQEQRGISVNQQQIIFNGENFRDELSIKDYNISEEADLLLVNKEKSLLLKSSIIFEGSNLTDRMRQSIIDINRNSQEEDVLNLLNEAISYLDDKLDANTAQDLLSLILSCFSYYPEQCLNFFDECLQKDDISIYHFIFMATIISNLAQFFPKIPINKYDDFISSSFQQISRQIEKSPNDNLEVFGYKIPQQFKNNFIIDIILLSNPTEQLVSKFYPYIISRSINESLLDHFVKKVYEAGLLNLIPESLFIEDNLFLRLSFANITNFLSISTEQTFRKNLPQIENTIINTNQMTQSLCDAIINKLIQYDIKINSFEKLFNQIDTFEINSKTYDYLNKYHIQLPEKITSQIKTIPKFSYYLKIFSHPEKLPEEFLSFALKEANELDIYDCALVSKEINSPVFKTLEFWKHILSLVSSSDEECSIKLIKKFAFYFEKNIKPEEINTIYDPLIFDEFPPDERQSEFLSKLIHSMNNKYYNELTSYKNIKRNKKLFEQKKVPCPTICELFYIVSDLTKKDLNPMSLYAYEFSLYREHNTFKFDLEIIPRNDDLNDEILIQFIKEDNNFSLIKNIDEKTLSLIACSLVYTSEKNHKDIIGLTKENVLPFYAISFNYLKKTKGNLKKSSDKMLNLLENACKDLNNCKSLLLNESINAILTNMKSLFDQFAFQIKRAFQILEILLNHLVNGTYLADKILLIFVFIQISCRENTPLIQENIILITQKLGIKLFDSILKNKGKIINDNRFNNYYQLNLNLLDTNELQTLILNEFYRTTSDLEIIQLITFITKNCRYLPQIKFNNISELYKKLVNDDKWDDYIILVQFMKSNNMTIDFEILNEKQIPFHISEELIKYPNYNTTINFIKYILNHSQIEHHPSIFEKLFEIMMKEQLFAYKFILSTIEKLTCIDYYRSEMQFKLSALLDKKQGVFNEYKDNLFFVLKHAYAYSETDFFVRKINVEPLSLPDVDYSFLELLINDQSYQSFLCLHYIASYFPFIFEPDDSSIDEPYYLLVVDLVLPIFENLSTIYDDDKSEEKNINLKKIIAALSFLYSCLNSTKFFSVFILWLFVNIENLSDSQVICMSAILSSVYNIKKVNVIILGYIEKYNFLDKMINLLSRNVSDQKFEQLYKRNLYENLTNHIQMIQKINHYEDILFIDQIKNGEITNPFELMFNNFSIIPFESTLPLQIIFPIENDSTKMFTDLMKNINIKQPLWISNLSNSYSNHDNTISEFISLFKNDKYVFIDEKLPYQPFPKTIKMQRYYNTQPKWIYNYIANYKKFKKLPEHYILLNETITKLVEIKQNSKTNSTEEDTEAPDKISPFEYLLDQFHHEKLFRKIIDELELTKDNVKSIYSLIIEYTKYTKNMITFLHIINDSFDRMESNYPYLYTSFLCKIAQVIYNCYQYNYDFDENFFKICGNRFIDITLKPTGRLSSVNLSNAAFILHHLDCQIPMQATHIIGFIFKFHKSRIPDALKLFSKLGEPKTANIFPIIKSSYEEEIKSENLNYLNMKYYLEMIPSLAKNDVPFLCNYIDKCIAKYKEEQYIDNNLLDLICTLFNFLAPERNQYLLIYSPKSSEIDFSQSFTNKKLKLKLDKQCNTKKTLLEPAPQSLLQSSKFWSKLYEKHREFISELLEKDELIFEKLTFLHDYHELVPFRIRSSYFRKYLKNQENDRKYINIEVSRSNILNDTFNSLIDKKPKELLGQINVRFIDEKGVDAGGLTSEWFSYVVKEIFNPDFGLFLKSENNCYHPNSLSYINNNHIQYFKLAGEIIALALVKNQCVNAHLSMAFYRQILHQKIKLKDLEDFDDALLNSLQMVLDADDVKDLDLVFSIDDDQFGKMTTIELIENGEKIEVTNENRMEYVSLYANYKLRKSVIKQISAFCDAFDEIISPKFIRIFTPSELDLMICGIPNIDVNDMKMFTQYENPYHKDHPTIIMFFNMLSKWDQENLAKFLLFLTGSSQVSVNGFKDFVDRGKPLRISPGGEKNRLPVAHTCFATLDLPEYDNEIDMNNKLMIAIQDCEFGLA